MTDFQRTPDMFPHQSYQQPEALFHRPMGVSNLFLSEARPNWPCGPGGSVCVERGRRWGFEAGGYRDEPRGALSTLRLVLPPLIYANAFISKSARDYLVLSAEFLSNCFRFCSLAFLCKDPFFLFSPSAECTCRVAGDKGGESRNLKDHWILCPLC